MLLDRQELIKANQTAVAASPSSNSEQIAQAEAQMLQHPQVDCPVIHRFGPGIYIREVHIPAGSIAIGHEQRFAQANMMLQGRVLMFNGDGSTTELVAPHYFVGQPGRKIGFILETVVWQNIYPNLTEERDIDALEVKFLIKSDQWLQSEAAQHEIERISRQADRNDYLQVLAESGFAHETAVAQSENQADQIPYPHEMPTLRILPSAIQGKGLFTSIPIAENTVIAPARIAGLRTPAGRYTNHSLTPNARMVMRTNGDIDLVSIKPIDGCKGGDHGGEITIDYRQALALSGVRLQQKEIPCLA